MYPYKIIHRLSSLSLLDFSAQPVPETTTDDFDQLERLRLMLGRVRVLLDDSGLTISNPGGFIEGVNVDNLIKAEPHGRNPALADALKRLGLAERTGRGIDRIYEGSLLFGKLLPDYSRSNERTVSLFIPKSRPDVTFTEMIQREQKRLGHSLSIQTLLVLNCLKRLDKASVDEIAEWVNGSDIAVMTELEDLVENGIVEYTGYGRYRKYMFSPKAYKQESTDGNKQSESDKFRFEEIILKEFSAQGFITRIITSELLNITLPQAYRVLNRMLKEGKLKMRGSGRNAGYVIN